MRLTVIGQPLLWMSTVTPTRSAPQVSHSTEYLRSRRPPMKTRLWTLSLLGACLVGCKPEPPAKLESPVVGHSPLRRLSNSEYLNALEDLFPGSHLTLPQLPKEATVAGFENGAESQTASDVLVARHEEIANSYAAAATIDLAAVATLTGCSETSCASDFIDGFGARVFRRPLTAAEHERWLRASPPGPLLSISLAQFS